MSSGFYAECLEEIAQLIPPGPHSGSPGESGYGAGDALCAFRRAAGAAGF